MLQITASIDPLTESNCYILAEEGRCVIIDPGESEGLFRILEKNCLEPDLILGTKGVKNGKLVLTSTGAFI